MIFFIDCFKHDVSFVFENHVYSLPIRFDTLASVKHHLKIFLVCTRMNSIKKIFDDILKNLLVIKN